MRKTLISILFATLACMGCGDDGGGGSAGMGGSAGGSSGSGGSAGAAGSAGSGGSAGAGGSAGVGGMPPAAFYEQDFEGPGIGGDTIGDGWLFFVNVFEDNGTRRFGYNGDAPDGTGFISGIVMGQGGATQGNQQLSVFSDYNCCDPDIGHRNGTDVIETNVFQERTIGSDDFDKTFTFSVDAKGDDTNGPSGDTTTNAFIKTLDPDAGFAESAVDTVDTTSLPTTWGRLSVSIDITSDLDGHILQFGFQSNASDGEPSNVFYDNVRVDAEDTP